MRTKPFVAGLLAVALLAGSPIMQTATAGGNDRGPGKAVAKTTTYSVDTEKSTLVWNAKKVGGEHTGNMKLSKGEITANGNKLTGGTFVADVTTLTENKNNERVVNHLKSDDFFAVEKNPTATFKITKVTPIANAKAGEPNYTVTGDMTIKGNTNPLTFPAVVKITNEDVEASAQLEVNRIPFDIKYRAAIIGTAADKIIDDNFTLDLKLFAKKSKPM
ncbi:YceI family protein [Larkinella soli]|uniref:YceI family protein n=1 Tax=Larkinella soli TaxID=1770527 RepID=UPI000FFC0DD8|nr:YceI family protein [Larkinella soli]